ncbi:glycosyltransferase family 2 protein [Variovorax sp. GT1P44]|uniref:glycosyltransferase family 2 protein n=1 Tax=Variovorax sp. GT1P44 TaxID=3443742 RepID=UPI003F48B4D3
MIIPPESPVHGLSISVALCTYNGARFIGEQIRSICLQTLPPREIVISDDASTDGCVDVARKAIEECNAERPEYWVTLRVLQNTTALRVTKNFEQAVRACQGDLIALSDQDDAWMPDRLARMAAQFEQRPDLLLLHTDARLVDGTLADLGQSLFHALEVKPIELERIHSGRAFDVLLRRNLVTGATTVFRRSLLDAALSFPSEWLHDEWLGIIAAAVGRVDLLEDPLIEYRQHASNQIGARRDTFPEKMRKAFGSRGDTHVKRAYKAELLLARLVELGDRVPASFIEKAQLKVIHQRFRATLPRSRLARCVPVLREVMTGRYDRFGRGVRGIVRDLFEAA